MRAFVRVGRRGRGHPHAEVWMPGGRWDPWLLLPLLLRLLKRRQRWWGVVEWLALLVIAWVLGKRGRCLVVITATATTTTTVRVHTSRSEAEPITPAPPAQRHTSMAATCHI